MRYFRQQIPAVRPSRLLFLFFLVFSSPLWAQKTATVTGIVVDEQDHRLASVSVLILGQQGGILTNDSGYFSLRVPANRAFALVFSYSGYKSYQQNFLLNPEENERVTVQLERGSTELATVVIQDQRARTEVGLIRPNPKNVLNLPSPVSGVESMIKVIVGSNNELTSQYNVRGGSYDENLIYVNDFEIFRPYLVRSGQQEGLSFINPALVRNISFYNGGFAARYGDKMSSVLDIQYNKPRRFGGSAYVGLLEQGAHVEGSNKRNTFSYLVGIRNRSNRNLLQSQETQGSYTPSSSDLQALLNWQLSPKWSAELLANYSQTKFKLLPAFSQLTSSVFSPLYTANLGVDIFFEGREKDQYYTRMLGVSTTYAPRQNLRLKFLASRFENEEWEERDISGAYLFGDRDFDANSATYGLIINPLGAGISQDFARNRLQISNYNFSHKGTLDAGSSQWQWGLGYDRTHIDDRLREWQYQDSAGYSLPYSATALTLSQSLRGTALLDINKVSGYLQNNRVFRKGKTTWTLQAGLRANYNDLNDELLVSPRIGASWKPSWKRDIVFRAAAGAYHQPPFYRELRRYDGTLNTALKAQRSWQGVAGLDYNFIGLKRPLRLTVEAYYKSLTNVVPYDIDNVRVRYFGENAAKAYAAGLEMRLFGELVKDAESWLSIGIMRTREDLAGDRYSVYT
ncbi:MAG: TonB-dependent receptor, partial [Chitinophagaceae bacterium]